MNLQRYNFSFWQPDPEIKIFNDPVSWNYTIFDITIPSNCGYFSNESDKENSDYYDFSGSYYQNTGFSEWYNSNTDTYYYSIYDLPDFCESSGGTTISYPYNESDAHFTILSDSPPSNFNDYGSFSFYYRPHLKVDKTIENRIGSSFTVSQIDVKVIYVSDIGEYVGSYDTLTYDVTVAYDAVTDKYIVYPTFSFFISSLQFSSILFVITYHTNDGLIVKHQTVNSYNNDRHENYINSYRYAFPTSLFNDGQTQSFYIPLHNEQLKYISDTNIHDVTYDVNSGLVTARVSAISPAAFTLNIPYNTSRTNGYTATLYIPYGNTFARCGSLNVSFGGYVGFAEYNISVASGTGLLEFMCMNYSIPDRFTVTANSTLRLDTPYIGHGYRAHLPITSSIVGDVQLGVYTNDPGTSWISTVECLSDYSEYSSSTTFDFNNEYSKDDILVLSTLGNYYVPAKEDVDYEFHSIVSPSVTRYTALTNVRVLLYNEKIVPKIRNVQMYVDPYTSLPVYHQELIFTYPGRVVMGNDLQNPTVGDIRINRAGLYGSFINYEVNIPESTSTMSVYKPLRILPSITPKSPFTSMGSVEYIKDSQVYKQTILVREYGETGINLIDPLRALHSVEATNSETLPYNQGLRYVASPIWIPLTTESTSGFGWHYEYNDNSVTIPFAQPFYNNTVGDKFFQITVTHDTSIFPVNPKIDTLELNVIDNDGTYTSTMTNISGNNTNHTIYVKYDGYDTQSMNVSISGSDSESFYMRSYVLNHLSTLLPTDTYNYSGVVFILKKDTTKGIRDYKLATLNIDYTKTGFSSGTITAINEVEVVTRVSVHPLISL